MFIPFVNLIISILVMANLATCFGRGAGTVLGLIFLPFISWPILGFGSAEYQCKRRPKSAAGVGCYRMRTGRRTARHAQYGKASRNGLDQPQMGNSEYLISDGDAININASRV